MLARIQELDGRPLMVVHPPEKRLVGNCRDFATMLCAMLRHQKVPARVRRGFASYFEPDFWTDHVVCEYWKADEGRWVLVDAQVDDVLRLAYQIMLDTCDLPREYFVLAGRAWQLYRAGQIDPDRFGIAPDGQHGLDFIRTGLLRDATALNKIELLTQDEWNSKGFVSEEGIAQTHADLLDYVAELTLAERGAVAEIAATRTTFKKELLPRKLSGQAPSRKHAMID